MIAPGSSAEPPRTTRIARQWYPARQADLPAMGMPAEQHIEAHMRRMPVDFGGVGQENRGRLRGDSLTGFLQIVGAVIMGIINPRQVDRLSTTGQRHGLVQP